MHLLSSFSLALVAATATADLQADIPEGWSVGGAPDVTVVEANKSYLVKLECLGCPFVVRESQFDVSWEHPPRDNALLLKFDIDRSASALLLDGHSVLPLGAMPLHINALQVPADISVAVMAQLIDGNLDPSFWSLVMRYPLQYEHTLLRTEVPKKWWVQFDVTGLAFGETIDPVKMDQEGQKMVEILLGKQENSTDLFIETLQVVERKDRVQPLRMKCGRLAMVQTSFDPNEWDEYGKLGTWTRMWSVFVSKLGDFWSESLQQDDLLLPLALLLAFSIVMARRWYQQRQQVKEVEEEEMETALLSSYYEDAPPAYVNIPVIKVEECD
ncbi:Nn.00g013260.m01.CDS01 [Neocucurbitaria sp. VM-36]